MNKAISTVRDKLFLQLKNSDAYLEREAIFPDIAKKIHVAIGMRRSGKTYFLFQKIRELLAKGVNPDAILYLNFEDDRLLEHRTPEYIAKLIEHFYTMYPDNHTRVVYLFLDEIQNIEGWEQIVRRFFDTKNIRLYLTGSSAKLLSTEIATSLRGRAMATEIWPLSFTEYLAAKNIDIPKKNRAKRHQDIMLYRLNQFLQEGGFPEVTLIGARDRNQIVQDYLNVVIFRNIVERHHVTNTQLIRYVIHTLLKRVGSRFSINKLFNDIKSQGMKVSKDTLYQYKTSA